MVLLLRRSIRLQLMTGDRDPCVSMIVVLFIVIISCCSDRSTHVIDPLPFRIGAIREGRFEEFGINYLPNN